MKSPIYRLSDKPLRLMAVTLALAVAGGLALSADAAPPPGMGGEPMMLMGAPGHMQHLLDAANATADQRSQIQAIMAAAHTDLKAQHDAGRTLHDQAMQLFTQPTVDARAVEALRQQMLSQQDQSSKRMMQAMLDVSRVLTPDQRQQIATTIAQHQATMQGHHGGGAANAPAAQ